MRGGVKKIVGWGLTLPGSATPAASKLTASYTSFLIFLLLPINLIGKALFYQQIDKLHEALNGINAHETARRHVFQRPTYLQESAADKSQKE
jgi:hypothetical protein